LLRNAISSSFVKEAVGSCVIEKHRFDIAYWGTISHWLDCNSLNYCLSCIPNLYIHLIGAAEHAVEIEHRRLIVHPPVPHHDLLEFSKEFHAFILPFKRTSLIDSVDPVKLYEYLATGKEVVSIRYPEVERFSSFVHFYENEIELATILRKLAAGKIMLKNASLKRAIAFLLENTWENRRQIVEKQLEVHAPL